MTFKEEIEKNALDLPIYQKGMEIYNVIDLICQVIENDKLSLGKEKDAFLTNAKLLSTKVVDVECDQNFDGKINGAAIIRRGARELSFHIDSIEAYGFQHVEYLEIIRPLIKEYRFLFNDWIAAFDGWDNKPEPWEFLKPPGAGPADTY